MEFNPNVLTYENLTCVSASHNINQVGWEYREGEKVGIVKTYYNISLDELDTRPPNVLVTLIPNQIFSLELPTRSNDIQLLSVIDSEKETQIIHENPVASIKSEQHSPITNLSIDQPASNTLSRRGKRWSVEEDATLQQEMNELKPDECTLIEYVEMHDTLSQIAEKHGRTSRAIKFRLLYLAHRTILKKLKECLELSLIDVSSELTHGDLFSRYAVPILENMYALTKLEYLEYIRSNPKEMGGVNQYLPTQ